MGRYKTYYGRRRSGWIKLAVAVAALAAVAVLCFFVLPDFIVYTDDGAYFDLSFLPWIGGRQDPSPSPPSPSSSVDLIIVTPSPSPAAPSPSPSPSPSAPAAPKAYFVPLTDAGNLPAIAALRDAAAARGANSIVLEYKNQQGTILSDDLALAAMEALRAGGLEVTALISVCVDNTIPLGVHTSWAVKHSSGVNFWDANKNRWINLHVAEAREYLIGVVSKALELGFDRVLLQNIGFPFEGGITQIRYGVDAHDPVAAVDLFIGELRAACGDDAPIDAVILERAVTEGVFETAGQSLESFKAAFDRLYVLLPEDAASVDEEFIPIISATDGQLDAKAAAASQGYLVMGAP